MLIKRFRDEHDNKHASCMRVSKDCFDDILSYIVDDIEKQDTKFREAIPPEQRLAVTPMYLSPCHSWKSLALLFRMDKSTTRGIVYEVCGAIWKNMYSKYLQTPSSAE